MYSRRISLIRKYFRCITYRRSSLRSGRSFSRSTRISLSPSAEGVFVRRTFTLRNYPRKLRPCGSRARRHAGQSFRCGQEQERRAAAAVEAILQEYSATGLPGHVFAQDASTLLERILINAKQTLSL